MFTQRKKLKIKTCDGCEYRCELGYVLRDKIPGLPLVQMWPTIDGCCIEEYIDPDGERVISHQSSECSERFYNVPEYKGLDFERDFGSPQHCIATIKLARRIATYCDHYKQR